MHSSRLADLAERIREASAAMNASAIAAAEKAIESGRLLIEAKAECRHGEWLPFLERAGVAERQAQRLMQLGRSGLKPDTVSDLGIKAALALAGRRQLPTGDDVLMLTSRDKGAGSTDGGRTAFLFEARETAGYYHVAAFDTGAPSLANATARPMSASRPDILFNLVDELLQAEPGSIEIELRPGLRGEAEALRALAN